MEDLVATINAALRARGWSARQASLRAVGNSEFIRTLRRGSAPPVDRFRALCETLGLDFYVGPRRDFASIDERRLEVAIETAVRPLESTDLELDPAELARAVVAIYELLEEGGTSANTVRVNRLIAALTSGRQFQRNTT